MIHIILWTDFLAFALLLTGMGAEFLAYLKKREAWRGFYILSILSYDLLLLVQALAYFNLHYLKEPIQGLLTLATIARPLISLVLVVVFPFCIARASGLRLKRAGVALLWLPALLTAAAILAAFAFASVLVSTVLNIAFNLFIAAFAVFGTLRVARGRAETPRAETLPFLLMSSIAYSAFVLLALLFVAGVKPLANFDLSSAVSGLFCMAWGILLIVSAIRRSSPIAAQPGSVAGGFALAFSLSPREAEVASLLAAGRTNREIGEALFISPRTVETHVYNLYRKTACRNKAEFVGKAIAFSPEGIRTTT